MHQRPSEIETLKAENERLRLMLHPQPLPCGHAAEYAHASSNGAIIKCCRCALRREKALTDFMLVAMIMVFVYKLAAWVLTLPTSAN